MPRPSSFSSPQRPRLVRVVVASALGLALIGPALVGVRAEARTAADAPAPTSAPTVTGVQGGDQAVTISWVPGKSGGPAGAALVEYEVTRFSPGLPTPKPTYAKPSARSHTVTGLTDGLAYTFTVAAVWADGSRSTSARTAAAVPPFLTAGRFVDRQVQDFLDRPPSADERTQIVDALDTGASTSSLFFALRRYSDAPTMVDPVARLYLASFLRAPDPTGFDYWVGRRRAGSVTLVATADTFAGSKEFLRRYGATTNRAFVELVYRNVLGRSADKEGLEYWTRQLDTKRRTRGGVMVGFSESKEFVGASLPRVDVSVLHLAILGEQPSAGLLAAEAADLTSGKATVGSLAAEMLGSPEYKAG